MNVKTKLALWSNVQAYKHWISKGVGYCAYCNEKLKKNPKALNDLHPTSDHQIPLSRGGKDTIENIVPCCIICNRMKGHYTVPEFIAKIEKIRNFLTNGE